MSATWVNEVLHFWFAELEPRQWFVKDDAVDDTIRTRFFGLHDRLATATEIPEATEVHGALACILVFDQFSRNLYRNSPQAFATDGRALAMAVQLVDTNRDLALNQNERIFLYMPFQHSEDLAMQRRSIELFSSLGAAESLQYARLHQQAIERFGRFSHRNEALGRTSTAEELDYLAKDGGF